MDDREQPLAQLRAAGRGQAVEAVGSFAGQVNWSIGKGRGRELPKEGDCTAAKSPFFTQQTRTTVEQHKHLAVRLPSLFPNHPLVLGKLY